MVIFKYVTILGDIMGHPEWALQHKTKGTELRNINGRFYLYRISSKWNKEKKVTQKITHEMIGRITEADGLIPKGSKREMSKKTLPLEEKKIPPISTRESGASLFLEGLCSDIIDAIKKYFPEIYREIFTMALNRLLHQSPLKNMAFLYESSMICEQFKGLDLSKNRLTSLMLELGSQRPAIADFMKHFVRHADNIVFDTTHSVSQSEKMQLNQVGYNSKGSFEPQVNLFYLFATGQQQPAYYRIFPGNIQGMSALKLTVKEAGIKDACMIGDKGFCSESNMDMFDGVGIEYILPLKRNSRFINYDRLQDRDYEKAFDGHFLYHNRPIFYYRYTFIEEKKDPLDETKIIKKERKIIVFCDPRLRTEEESSYLRRVDDKTVGYTMESFKARQFSFGTMAMTHNLNDNKEAYGNTAEVPAKKIYEKYKSRMEVETVFDMYKNLLQADRSYMQSDEAFEAWVFINHLATMMYYKVFNVIREKDKLGSISPKDLLMRLARISKLKIGDQWVSAEIPRSSQTMFKTLGITVT